MASNPMGSGLMRGWKDFIAGIPVVSRFKVSLRVGGGAATLAALDGGDGFLMADGASAILLVRDRALNTRYFGWYQNDTIRFYTSTSGDTWTIDKTTGIATLTAATAGTWVVISSFTNSWVDENGTSGMQTVRYKMDICGNVHLQGSIKSGTINTAAFTLPAGFRPPGALPRIVVSDATNVACMFSISTAGVCTPVTGSTTGIRFNIIFPTT